MNQKYLIGMLVLFIVLIAGGGYFILHKSNSRNYLNPDSSIDSSDCRTLSRSGQVTKGEMVCELSKLDPNDPIRKRYEDLSPELAIPSNWKTYTSTDYGYEFKYPSDWKMQEGSNWVGVSLTGNPTLQTGNAFLITIFDQSFQSTEAQLDANLASSSKKTNVTVGGLHAVRYIFTTEFPLPVSTVFIESKGKNYQIDMWGGSEVLELEAILSTLEFTK